VRCWWEHWQKRRGSKTQPPRLSLPGYESDNAYSQLSLGFRASIPHLEALANIAVKTGSPNPLVNPMDLLWDADILFRHALIPVEHQASSLCASISQSSAIRH
jgi:hypothetical protein